LKLRILDSKLQRLGFLFVEAQNLGQ